MLHLCECMSAMVVNLYREGLSSENVLQERLNSLASWIFMHGATSTSSYMMAQIDMLSILGQNISGT